MRCQGSIRNASTSAERIQAMRERRDQGFHDRSAYRGRYPRSQGRGNDRSRSDHRHRRNYRGRGGYRGQRGRGYRGSGRGRHYGSHLHGDHRGRSPAPRDHRSPGPRSDHAHVNHSDHNSWARHVSRSASERPTSAPSSQSHDLSNDPPRDPRRPPQRPQTMYGSTGAWNGAQNYSDPRRPVISDDGHHSSGSSGSRTNMRVAYNDPQAQYHAPYKDMTNQRRLDKRVETPAGSQEEMKREPQRVNEEDRVLPPRSSTPTLPSLSTLRELKLNNMRGQTR